VYDLDGCRRLGCSDFLSDFRGCTLSTIDVLSTFLSTIRSRSSGWGDVQKV